VNTLRTLTVWIARNAALLTAVSSMVIAGLSLKYTIDAQRRDFEYRELSIQPRLVLGGNADAFALSVKNVGVGAALIWRIEVVVNGNCQTTDGKSQVDWATTYRQFVQQQIQKLYTEPFIGTPNRKKGASSVLAHSDILYVGDVIPAGKKPSLIEMDDTQSKFLQQIDRGLLANIQTKFMDAAYAAPIRITICSLSGRSCNVVGVAEQCGRTVKFPRRARPIRPDNEFETED
jgi:hypothetical protein